MPEVALTGMSLAYFISVTLISCCQVFVEDVD